MGIDLKTIKRGSNLLQENVDPANKVKKKLGRKKIENEEEKLSEKVVTYVTKKEKLRLNDLFKDKGMNQAQYVRMVLLNNIK